MVITTEELARFEAKIDKAGECWVWTAGKTNGGYGRFRFVRDGQEKFILAHRLSYMLRKGAVPEGMCVRHACDNPACVNPDHLIVGTLADNVADRVARGRSAKGDDNGRSKFDAVSVRLVRHLLGEGRKPYDLARICGVDPKAIRDIGSGKNWGHVPPATDR